MAKINRSLAIVIGIDQYTHIPKLKNAGFDATELANVLKNNYGYEVLLLLDQNATKEKFDELLANLEKKTIQFDNQSIKVEETDRVLFYFAGHGFAEEAQDSEDGKPAGYFMPQNAEDGNSKTWLSMQKLYEGFTNLDCHHLLMILDCCFAGRISWAGKGRNAARSRKLYKQSYDRFIKYQTEQIITSAAHDEKAQDSFRFGQRGDQNGHSPFAHLLLKVLQHNSDGGKDKFIEAIVEDKVITVHELFTYLQNQLEKVADGQTPALSQPRKYDQETGQYIFFKGEYIFPFPNFNPQDLIPLKLDESTNPYKGLASYEKEDRQLFFGRKRLIEDPKEGLLSKVSNHPLTIVLGLSGSGKSSLVKAGLIPALKLAQETGQQKWVFLETMRPSESPFNALNQILTPSGSDSSEFSSLNYQEKVKSISNNIAQVISPYAKLLLVIDQAEELFTLCQNPEERTEFINLLAQLLTTYREQLRIVLTLRSEFEPQIRDALKEPDRQKVWQDGRFIVTPMDREELQQVIEEPAAQRALFFESPKLVNDLIDEVVQMPGALPLLSFTLSELYLKYLKAEEKLERNDRTITEADYQKIGGVTRSLTQTADKTYNKLVNEEKVGESTIRDVMLRMVAISGGELARRRVPKSELVYPGPKNEQVQKVIKCFEDARLLVKPLDTEKQEYVEPVHDALIMGWAKIKYWLDEKQEIVKQGSGWNPIKKLLTESKVPLFLASKENGSKSDLKEIREAVRPEAEKQLKVNLPLQRDVTTAAFKWEDNKKETKYLWNASPYLDVLKLVLKSELNNNWLNQIETKFMECSVGQKRKNTYIRWSIAGSVIVGAVIFSALVWTQWRSSQLNLANSLARNSRSLLAENQGLDAWVEAIKAGRILQKQKAIDPVVKTILIQVASDFAEYNRLEVERSYDVYVLSVSFNPNGKILASGSHDGTIRLWDVETGKEIGTPLPHDDKVLSVSFSPDGKILASGGLDGTIKLWDVETKKEIGTPLPHDDRVLSVSFSPNPNEQILASGSAKGTVKLWDITRKREIHTLNHTPNNHDKSVVSVSFSHDGKTLASGSETGTIKLWNVETGKEIPTSMSHDQLSSLSLSPDGKILASGGHDGTIKLWDLKTGKEIPTMIKTVGSVNKPVRTVSFSPNGQILASVDGSTIKLWDLTTKKVIRTLKGHSLDVMSVNFSPDGNTLASGGLDSTIRFWNLKPSQEVRTIKENNDLLQVVSFSQDGKISASEIKNGDSETMIRLKNLETGKEIDTFKGLDDHRISINFSPDGHTLAAGNNNGTIKLWNLEKTKEPITLQGQPKRLISSVSFSHDGKILAFGDNEDIQIWDLESIKKIVVLEGEKNAVVRSISFSHDGKTLASGGDDRTIKLWNLETKTEIPTNMHHDGDILSVSFSHDGNTLASGGRDNTIKLWDLKTKKQIPIPNPMRHGNTVDSLSFSSNGNTLASGGRDNTIKLWDLKTKEEIVSLKGHDKPVDTVSFSRDSNTLASGSWDNTIKIWNLDLLTLDSLIEHSCDHVRNYLQNNPNVSESDRHLCDGIGTKQ